MKSPFAFALALQLMTPTLFAFPWDGEQPQGTPPDRPQFESTISTARHPSFFSYPQWWPRQTASADTPGSCDWYVEGVTGVTYAVGFDVAVNGVVNTNLVMAPMEGMFPDENGFYSWNLPLVDGDEYLPGADTRLYTDATAPFGAKWWGWHEERVGTNTVVVTNVYTATASQFERPTYYNGFWQGRAARLTPEVLSGVNSTFEGLYERMYYCSQYGGTNWSVSATNGWGGTTPETFRLDGAADTNDLDRSYLQDYHCPTDGLKRTMPRKIFTRRLAELENILRFTGESDFRQMCGTNCPPGGSGVAGVIGGVFDRSRNRDFRVQRPTWPDVWVWSTSMFDNLVGSQAIPTVDWTENPWATGGGDEWLKRCLPLRALDGASIHSATNAAHHFSWPVEHAFDAVRYGEDFWFSDLETGALVYDATNACVHHTFDGMLTNFYPSVCTTNFQKLASRRLQFDALARANQRLSALDRTIMEDQVARTNRLLARDWTCGMKVVGKVTITGYDLGPGMPVVFDWQPAEWGAVDEEWKNVVTNRDERGGAGERRAYVDASYPSCPGISVAPATAFLAEQLFLKGDQSLIQWAKSYGPIRFLGIQHDGMAESYPIIFMMADNDPSHMVIQYYLLPGGSATPPGVGPHEVAVVCVGQKTASSIVCKPNAPGDYYLTHSLHPLRQELLNKISSSTVSAFLSARTLHYSGGDFLPDATNTGYSVRTDHYVQPNDLLAFVRSYAESVFAKLETDVLESIGWDGNSPPTISRDELAPGFSRNITWSFGNEDWRDIFSDDWDHDGLREYYITTNGVVESQRSITGDKREEPWPFCCARIRRSIVCDLGGGTLPIGEKDRRAEGEARYYDVETVDWDWDALKREAK